MRLANRDLLIGLAFTAVVVIAMASAAASLAEFGRARAAATAAEERTKRTELRHETAQGFLRLFRNRDDR